jgi:gas vesicle protein
MNNQGAKTMSSGKVLLGIVAGAAAGAIVGMLIAPTKGSATRKKLARKGTEYAEDAKETINKYVDTLADEYETVKEGARDLVERGKEKAISVARAKHAR